MTPRLFAVATLLATIAVAQGARLPLAHYTVADGLPSDDVRALLFDRHGFLWIGTTDGLARFDGHEFRAFGVADGLPHAAVWSLLETRDGELWVGTDRGLARVPLADPRGAGLTVLDAEGWSPARRAAVLALTEDRAGRIWVGTLAGLYVFERHAGRWRGTAIDVGAAAGAPPPWITSIVETPDGALWCASNVGIYRRGTRGAWCHLGEADGLPTNVVRRLVPDRFGRVWVVGHGESLAVLDAGPDGNGRVARTLAVRGGDAIDGHFTLGGAPPDEIWLTSWSGITRLDPVRVAVGEHFGPADGLPAGQEPRAIVADARGDLWLGTSSAGLWLWRRDGAVTFGAADGIAAGVADSLYVSPRGELVAVNRAAQHALLRVDGRRFVEVHPRFPADHPAYWRTPVMQDRRGAWWIGTARGACRFPPAADVRGLDGTAAERCYGAADGLDGAGFGLFEDRRGDVWISTWSKQRPLVRWERASGRLVTYGAREGLGEASNFPVIVDDAAGHVWFGSWDGGLVRFDGTRFRRFEPGGGLLGGSVADGVRDMSGRLWFTMHLNGVTRVDDPASAEPRFTHLGLADGLASVNVAGLAAARDGAVWIGSSRGVTRLDGRGHVVRHLGVQNGLPHAAVGSLALDGSGRLWATTAAELACLRTPDAAPAPPGDPRIASLRIAGRAWPLPLDGLDRIGTLDVPAAAPDIEVGISSPSFGLGEEVQYLVRLDGPVHVEIPPRHAVAFDFPRLVPGEYAFTARTVARDGTTSRGVATLRFRVLAPWWRRPLAWIAAGLALAAAAFTAHRVRVARLLAVERMRTRIATDLHDDIGSSLSSIAVQGGLLHRRLQAIAPEDRERLARITSTAGELVETMGDIVWSVNPRYDHLSDLAHRMHHFARETADAAGIALTFDAPLGHDTALEPPVRRQVYLIFKELVINAVKHSGARHLAVSLARADGRLVLHVQDDGLGLPPKDERRAGTGLASMQRRAAAIGGRLDLESAPGGGVTATLTL